MKKPRLYRKLAAAHLFGVTRGGWLSLYLGPDHLLLRKSTGFAESYRRFYFGDIEAITIGESPRGIVWNSVLGFGLFFSVLPLLLQRGSPPVAGSFAAVFVLLLGWNLARGTTCKTQLQTRVQTQALPLRRVRKALRVVDQISGKIREAQAQIAVASPAQLEATAALAKKRISETPVPPPFADEMEAVQPGWTQVATLALLGLTGIIALVAGLRHQLLLMYCVLGLMLGNVALGIAALVQQRSKRLPSRPALAVWISLIGHAVFIPIIYTVFSSIYTFQQAKGLAPGESLGPTQPTVRELITLPGFDYTVVFYSVCCLLLAVGGGIALATDPSRRASGITR